MSSASSAHTEQLPAKCVRGDGLAHGQRTQNGNDPFRVRLPALFTSDCTQNDAGQLVRCGNKRS
jgi:hypothetical protein